jgi:PIN domain nuclease of toxin-antitoxin system
VSSRIVLDASALLALLNSEEGSETVSKMLPGSALSAVNLCEVVGKLTEAGMPEEPIRAALASLGLEIHAFDEENAYAAGLLRKRTKMFGLSLGDRACIALALHLSVDVLTADHDWKKLKLPVKVQTIRRSRC